MNEQNVDPTLEIRPLQLPDYSSDVRLEQE